MLNKRGFTLIEILFVLAIVAAMALVGFRQYQLYQWRADAHTIRQSAAYLLQGLNSYYFQNCNELGIGETSMLFNAFESKNGDGKYLPKNIMDSIRNPWAVYQNRPFDELIIKPIRNHSSGKIVNYSLRVTATLNKDGTVLKNLPGILNAAGATGQKFTWMRLPNQEIKGMNSGLWILNGGLQQFGQVVYKADHAGKSDGEGIVQYCQAQRVSK